MTKALSERAAYITQANAICQVMNAQTRALPSQSADPATIAVVTDRVAAITSVALGRLRALRAPAGQANAVRAVFAKVDRTIADEAQISAALRSSKITDAERIRTQLQADAAAANAAADAYGLTVCGESS